MTGFHVMVRYRIKLVGRSLKGGLFVYVFALMDPIR